MSNPTIPWELVSLDRDTDAALLMQDFLAILDFCQIEVVHRHHLQFATFDLPVVGAAGAVSVTGITWPSPFPSGVTPYVMAQQNSSAGFVGGVSQLTFYPFNITNAGCDVRIANNHAATATTAAPGGGKLLAVDPTFDVSI